MASGVTRDRTLDLVLVRRERFIGLARNPHVDVARRAVLEVLERNAVRGGDGGRAAAGWLDAIGAGPEANARRARECRDELCGGCGRVGLPKAVCDVCGRVRCAACVLGAKDLGALVDAAVRRDPVRVVAQSAGVGARIMSMFGGGPSDQHAAAAPVAAAAACDVCRVLIRRWAFEMRVRCFRSPVTGIRGEVVALREQLETRLPQARGLVMTLQAARGEAPHVPQIGEGEGEGAGDGANLNAHDAGAARGLAAASEV